LNRGGTGGAFIMVTNENKTSPILILAAWVVVSIPAAWGIYYTLMNALKLFQ
jgi:hypothetical protein